MEYGMYIKIEHLCKSYLSTLQHYLKGREYMSRQKGFMALDDISLHIHEGEKVGIIGRNGAGKSTLLNIISGYSSPTAGSIEVNGTVTPVMEIGSSINPEHTGRENIISAGHLSGEDDLLAKIVQQIIDFVDIGDYIDRPMSTYSSGMIAKVSFGCIMFIRPEILVIDEVLGVGDSEFKKKSEIKIKELCDQGKILLLVSHSMSAIRKYTERCVWIDKGKVLMDGPSDKVTFAYEQAVKVEEEAKMLQELERITENAEFAGRIKIDNAAIQRPDGKEGFFEIHEDVIATFELLALQDCTEVDLVVRCYGLRGFLVCENKLEQDTGKTLALQKGDRRKFTFRLHDCNFNTSTYSLTISAMQQKNTLAEKALLFRVVNNQYYNYIDMPEICFRSDIVRQRLVIKTKESNHE